MRFDVIGSEPFDDVSLVRIVAERIVEVVERLRSVADLIAQFTETTQYPGIVRYATDELNEPFERVVVVAEQRMQVSHLIQHLWTRETRASSMRSGISGRSMRASRSTALEQRIERNMNYYYIASLHCNMRDEEK